MARWIPDGARSGRSAEGWSGEQTDNRVHRSALLYAPRIAVGVSELRWPEFFIVTPEFYYNPLCPISFVLRSGVSLISLTVSPSARLYAFSVISFLNPLWYAALRHHSPRSNFYLEIRLSRDYPSPILCIFHASWTQWFLSFYFLIAHWMRRARKYCDKKKIELSDYGSVTCSAYPRSE